MSVNAPDMTQVIILTGDNALAEKIIALLPDAQVTRPELWYPPDAQPKRFVKIMRDVNMRTEPRADPSTLIAMRKVGETLEVVEQSGEFVRVLVPVWVWRMNTSEAKNVEAAA